MRRRCPVCRQVVLRTTKGNIHRHWDSIGRDICPCSGEPYELTEVGRRNQWIRDTQEVA